MTRVWTPPWDDGIAWRSEVVTPPDASVMPLDLDFVRDKVIRVVDDGYGDSYIESLMWAAVAAAEDATKRAIMPQTLALILSGFPVAEIPLPSPPLVTVRSFTYTDSAGDEQTVAGSPQDYRVIPSGRFRKASVAPLAGASWPIAIAQPDAVRIEYRAGYEDVPIPADIQHGMYLFIGELYKQRDLSVQGSNTMVPSVLQLDRFWKPVY